MENRSTRASSDDESDASRTQRQAIGGAPQARSGVERDNLRDERGASIIVRSNDETPCNDENQPQYIPTITTDAEPVSWTICWSETWND